MVFVLFLFSGGVGKFAVVFKLDVQLLAQLLKKLNQQQAMTEGTLLAIASQGDRCGILDDLHPVFAARLPGLDQLVPVQVLVFFI